MPSRLIVRDCQLTPEAKRHLEQIDTGLQFTEWKFENALDRVSASANPRQLERVPAGASFEFEIVYNVEVTDATAIEADLLGLLLAMGMLEDDYLGGHGSRGYGRVRWEPKAFVGRTLGYYSATSAAERSAAEISVDVDSLDACREKVAELVLGVLEAVQPEPEPSTHEPGAAKTDADVEAGSEEPAPPAEAAALEDAAPTGPEGVPPPPDDGASSQS